MDKDQLIEVAINTLRTKNFTALQLTEVTKVLEELIPEISETNEISVLLKYADYLYKEKWGKYEIFLNEEITTYVRLKIVDFLKHYALTLDKAKEYVKWLNEMSYNLFKRKMQIYDLYNSKIFDLYINRNPEDKSMFVDKKKLNSKRILTAD